MRYLGSGLVFLACSVLSFPAFSACINPVGDHGDMLYNRDHTVMQYCNGSDWVSMDASRAGGSDNLGNHTATQDLDMASFKVKNAAVPTSSADVTNKAYVDAAVASAAGGGGGSGLSTTCMNFSTANNAQCPPGWQQFGADSSYNPYNTWHRVCCIITGAPTPNFDVSFSSPSNYTWNTTDDIYTNTVSLNGFVGTSPASVTGGISSSMSVSSRPFVSSSLIIPGDTIRLKSKTPGSGKQTVTLNIDGTNYLWQQLEGKPVTENVDTNYAYTNVGTVTGISGATNATLSGGTNAEFRTNSGSWRTSGNISPGDTIEIRSKRQSTAQEVALSYGGMTNTWSVLGVATKGAFVLTQGQWNGNLGGLAGANQKCVTDLQTYDWKDKAMYTITAATVKAFLCTKSTCNNLFANTQYMLAKSGNPSIGGHVFTTDSSGRGPNDTLDWSGATAFGANYSYWTRRNSETADRWATTGSGNTCADWTHGTYESNYNDTDTGSYGTSTTGTGRWNGSTWICSSNYGLICMVTP